MTRPVRSPNGCWPLEMQSDMAAAFCDEPSVESFLQKVDLGIYSKPVVAPHCRNKWHRLKLEADAARRHGLSVDGTVEDAADLIE